ncbi:hypothetical protein [Maribacter sp. 2307ULW6-5]|uniref:hypothetical protein n=1 Tax=Maribacter sp. 2307ULW6-5 TaxID=3386275 RepID=UPI0039BD0F5E
MRKYLFVICLTLCTALFAQEQPAHKNPPIPVEFSFGHNHANLQAVFNRAFTETSRFGFFNVTTASVPYQNEDGANELVSINTLTYEFMKNLRLSAGVQFHFLKGFVPTTGVQYTYATKTWLIILTPNLNYKPSLNFETIAIVEFKPKITKKLGVYTRVQGLYNQNLDSGFHDRSYLNIRAGLSYNTYAFGFAANWDNYGPNNRSENNFGVFIRHGFN